MRHLPIPQRVAQSRFGRRGLTDWDVFVRPGTLYWPGAFAAGSAGRSALGRIADLRSPLRLERVRERPWWHGSPPRTRSGLLAAGHC